MGHWEVERGVGLFGAFNGSGKGGGGRDGLDGDMDAS